MPKYSRWLNRIGKAFRSRENKFIREIHEIPDKSRKLCMLWCWVRVFREKAFEVRSILATFKLILRYTKWPNHTPSGEKLCIRESNAERKKRSNSTETYIRFRVFRR